MKKIISMICVLLLAFVLIACDKDDGKKQKITLSYADWGDAVTNQKMIDAFEAKYDYIDVVLRDDIAGSGIQFTENLEKAAVADMLPDVFATDNVPTVITKGLVRDVAKFWDADEDAKLVYPNIANTAIYNSKRYAIPSFQFFKGIALNKDIFEKASLTTVEGKYRVDADGLPVKDWTYDEMVALAKAIKNRDLDEPSEFVLGIEPWYGTMDFQQVWPTLDNKDMQYDTWDGTKFNYSNKLWIDAMKEKVKVHQLNDGTIDDILPTEIFEVDKDGNPTDVIRPGREFLNGWKLTTGYTAMGIHGTWNLTTLITDPKENWDIDMGFWPYPGGDEGQFPPVILDYQCVSSLTAHPEEAYLLAKWMTYGKDGWDARMDIFEDNHDAAIADGKIPPMLTAFPVADYDTIWARILPYVEEVDGLTEIIDNLDKSKPDIDKWMPGYRDFWTWVNDAEGVNPYSWAKLLEQGPNSVETFATQWNSKVNELVQAQMVQLGK